LPQALFRRYFPEAELSFEAAGRLSRLDQLTPGDFITVLSRLRFQARPSALEIMTGLLEECRYKTVASSIGFKV